MASIHWGELVGLEFSWLDENEAKTVSEIDLHN